jgi:hypothetical protein
VAFYFALDCNEQKTENKAKPEITLIDVTPLMNSPYPYIHKKF